MILLRKNVVYQLVWVIKILTLMFMASKQFTTSLLKHFMLYMLPNGYTYNKQNIVASRIILK